MQSVVVPRKHPVLGVDISTTSYDEVVQVCHAWLEARHASSQTDPAHYICITSVHGIMTAFFNCRLRHQINSANIATPDGMPVVWALRSFGFRTQSRVYGPNLMLAICADAEHRGRSIYLYGSRPETLGRLCRNLKSQFPRLIIAGSFSPPFRTLRSAENEAIIYSILESGADIVFVGLSTPKQEHWMADNQLRLPNRILVGVGAAFDFHAGTVRQAPAWMQQAGLEWLFRFIVEPKRLWKRYLLVTPWFIPLWALQKVGILRYAQRES